MTDDRIDFWNVLVGSFYEIGVGKLVESNEP